MASKEEVIKSLSGMNILNEKNEYISTGILPLDMFVSGKNEISEDIGFVRGKFVSLSGPSGIGKSTLCMDISRRLCMKGLKVIYCDYEHGLNVKCLKDFEVYEYAAFNLEDPRGAIVEFIEGKKSMLIIDPSTFNKTALIWHQILNDLKLKVDVGIFDSLKAMKSTYSEENIDSLEQLPVGINARSQENFLPFMKTLFSKHNVMGLFVNQFRTQIASFGGFQAEPSNNAFLFNMDERMIMKPKKKGEIEIKVLNDAKERIDKKIGNWTELTLNKSRVGNSFSSLSLPIIFGKGVSLIYKYAAILIGNGIIPQPGSSDAKNDLTKLKETLGEGAQVPVAIGRGINGINEVIKANFAIVEKYILDNNLLFIEKII
jgi:RecA/RadA recombinase